STLEMKTQYLAPLKGTTARCVASFIRKGKGISFLEARLFDDQGQLAVAATSTWKVNRAKDAEAS
ncbi:PaaI family thioesterase, partial [Acinetobacter baumannii]